MNATPFQVTDHLAHAPLPRGIAEPRLRLRNRREEGGGAVPLGHEDRPRVLARDLADIGAVVGRKLVGGGAGDGHGDDPREGVSGRVLRGRQRG